MNLERERELFKQAYINLRSGSNIPFPDDVFDEYLRLREEEGYKMVPVEPTQRMVEAAIIEGNKHGRTDKDIYKAMLGAVDE